MDYLIWSNEHGAWWRRLEDGYTQDLALAGRYPRGRAVEIVAAANVALRGEDEPNEVMVVAPEHSWHGRR